MNRTPVGGWAVEHARVLAFFGMLSLGVVLAGCGHPIAAVCFAAAATIAYLTVNDPDSPFAIQEDARARERRRLEGVFARCLVDGGLEAEPPDAHAECRLIDPPTFLYRSAAYGVTEDRVREVCERSLEAFGAVRYTADRIKMDDDEAFGYAISFPRTTETEALQALSVTYDQIEGIAPTYKRISVGLFEDGSPAFMSLDNRNALIGGLPRSGKSVLLSTLVAGLCRCEHERILILSPKTLDFHAFAPRVELYQKPNEMLDALAGVSAEIERRKDYCVRTGKKKVDSFTRDRPHVSIVVDEYAVVRSARIAEDGAKKPRDIGGEIERELFAIVSQGAFSGCQVCLISQRLSSNVISTDLRDICAGNLVSFANGSETSDRMIFGEYAPLAPASRIPITAKGIGYLFAEGDMGRPRLFKCAITDAGTGARIARESSGKAGRR